MAKEYPGFLAAMDHKRKRIFVLSAPNLSAVKIDGKWELTAPLSDEEIKHYELIRDLEIAKSFVDEARKELEN